MTAEYKVHGSVAVITMANPPVNALTVAGWFELADVVTRAGRDPQVGALVLRAEGKGFNAGVDIKEMQNTEGFDALIGANRGCYAAFKAVYECEVPVIAAVHDFCLGGGIGLVGNADDDPAHRCRFGHDRNGLSPTARTRRDRGGRHRSSRGRTGPGAACWGSSGARSSGSSRR